MTRVLKPLTQQRDALATQTGQRMDKKAAYISATSWAFEIPMLVPPSVHVSTLPGTSQLHDQPSLLSDAARGLG